MKIRGRSDWTFAAYGKPKTGAPWDWDEMYRKGEGVSVDSRRGRRPPMKEIPWSGQCGAVGGEGGEP